MKMSYKGAVAGISLIVAGLLGATAHAADKIAFIAANMANESQAFSSKQFQKYGKDYGFEVVVLDAKGDTQTESQLVTNRSEHDCLTPTPITFFAFSRNLETRGEKSESPEMMTKVSTCDLV